MADLFLIANPKGASEAKIKSNMDRMVKLINQAEIYLKQPVRDIEGIKALAAEMDEMGLKHWAKELRKMLE